MTHRPVLAALAAATMAACSAGTTAYRAGSPSAPAGATYATSEAPARPGAYGPPGAAAGGDSSGWVAEPAPAPAPERPGLGTEYGEALASRVVEQSFERAAANPFALVAIHYNDAAGVQAQAAYHGASLAPIWAETPAGGVSIALIDESGGLLPGFSAAGRTYVVGQAGRRYSIRVDNHTGGRYELVASVDGLDVIDGRSASYDKRGYILMPGQTLDIDGFRTSEDQVAAFRFGRVAASYAARTGDDRNVGVIGLALFAERGSVWTEDELERRESADPFPSRYAAPPR